MAITSIGYDGTVSETAWSSLAGFLGREPRTGNAASLLVTTTAASYGLSVAAGTAYGDGVVDALDAPVTLTGSAPASGSRYDTVVLRRNWSGTGGVTTIQLVTGGTTATVTRTYTSPGTTCDYPLALVRFTSTSTTATVTDLRCYGGMVPVYAGTAALPAAGDVSTGYLALVNTTTGNLFDVYVSKGTVWENLSSPGWRTLDLSSTVTAYQVTPKYSVVGSTVHIRGKVQRSSGSNFLANSSYSIGSLPSYLAPSAEVNVAVPSATGLDSVCRATVETGGAIRITTGDQAGEWTAIDMTYLI